MLIRLMVEVDMFSVLPYYGLEKEKKPIYFDLLKCHDSYLMKCFHNNITKTIQNGDTGLTTSSF